MNKPKLDDPDLSLADLMTHWPRTIPVFIRHRMLCVGCPISGDVPVDVELWIKGGVAFPEP